MTAETYVMVQFSSNQESRTYVTYPSFELALEGTSTNQQNARHPYNTSGVCLLYEQGLKAIQPQAHHIAYDVTDLFNFIDHLADIVCFTPQADGSSSYHYLNKHGIKNSLLEQLKKQTKASAIP
eukprot:TRINITY_DN116284_c0_g1_i1.p1 TRINITY_DN116284_c0_g1~~TRINITY_DN116284_c0_g1_i1.p1  ORF type:complete len:124 (-),score=13.06 TRINITY_DN116284_c0_g1_i1:196-567(-)